MCRCFYCRHFLDYASLNHKWYIPFVKLWFFIPKYIYKKNCVEKDGLEGTLTLTPWLGFIVVPVNQGVIHNKWWKDVYFSWKALFSSVKLGS